MPVIFVTGVHGVGKSTLCATVSPKTNIPSFTASELIRAKRSELIQTGTKNVVDVTTNQNILITAVQEQISKFRTIIVDGHVTLFSNGSIVPIDYNIFKSINVKLIIIVLENPATIYSRLSSRDGNTYSVNVLRAHQTLELKHARKVASELGITLVAVRSYATQGLVDLIISTNT